MDAQNPSTGEWEERGMQPCGHTSRVPEDLLLYAPMEAPLYQYRRQVSDVNFAHCITREALQIVFKIVNIHLPLISYALRSLKGYVRMILPSDTNSKSKPRYVGCIPLRNVFLTFCPCPSAHIVSACYVSQDAVDRYILLEVSRQCRGSRW